MHVDHRFALAVLLDKIVPLWGFETDIALACLARVPYACLQETMPLTWWAVYLSSMVPLTLHSGIEGREAAGSGQAVSYTHLRAHET